MKDGIKRQLREWSFLFWFYFGVYLERFSNTELARHLWFDMDCFVITSGFAISVIFGLLLFLLAKIYYILRE